MFAHSPPPPAPILSVSSLNRLVRDCLEAALPLCWVGGEISNLTYAASGHVYFSLKDEKAQVRCVMWRNKAQLLGWRLENGNRVEARVLAGFYEPRGEFQLNVETVRRAGQGDLFERFLKLKATLEAEGLFAADRKRPLPAFPRRIGIVTSPQAAALRDVLTTLRRRAPHIALRLYPTPVQGDGAGPRIAAAIAAAAGDGNDLLILCRGGGSLEDLWAFNDETVARAIRATPVPVVSGVGHETDFTIADFAADLRAPTPTAAAELSSPDRAALLARLDAVRQQLLRRGTQQLGTLAQCLDWIGRRLLHPAQRLARQRDTLESLRRRLRGAHTQACSGTAYRLDLLRQRLSSHRPQPNLASARLENAATRLGLAWQRELSRRAGILTGWSASLSQLNPHAVLARGYTLVIGPDGRAVRDARDLSVGASLSLTFAQGQAQAKVSKVVVADEAD